MKRNEKITLTDVVFLKRVFFTENQVKVVGEMRGKVGARIPPITGFYLRSLRNAWLFQWQSENPEGHQMELPTPLISWVNPFPGRVINRTIFFCDALESHECACCLLSFLYFHWLFPLSACETFPGNRSIYKSTRERVDPNGLYNQCIINAKYAQTWMVLKRLVNVHPVDSVFKPFQTFY